MNLQAQLASLKEQAAESIVNGSVSGGSVYEKINCRKVPSHFEDLHSWFQSEQPNVTHEFDLNPTHNNSAISSNPYYDENYRIMVNNSQSNNGNNNNNYEHHHHHQMATKMEESGSYGSYEEQSSGGYSMYTLDHLHSNVQQWTFNDTAADDLQSVAFGNARHW